MLGSSKDLRDIPERVGYNRVWLGIEDTDGNNFTLAVFRLPIIVFTHLKTLSASPLFPVVIFASWVHPAFVTAVKQDKPSDKT